MTSPNDDLLHALRTLTQGVEPPTHEQWDLLVETFDALDASLCGGGPLPVVWTAEYIRGQLREIARQVTAEVLGEEHRATPGTVYGIRPHRPVTPQEDAALRALAEATPLWEPPPDDNGSGDWKGGPIG